MPFPGWSEKSNGMILKLWENYFMACQGKVKFEIQKFMWKKCTNQEDLFKKLNQRRKFEWHDVIYSM